MRMRCTAGLAFLLVGLVGLLAPLHARTQAQAPTPTPAQDEAAQPPEGWPVSLDGEVLFHVSAPLGPFSAEERAEESQQRIERIARDPFYSPDLLRIEERDDEVRVYYRDKQVGALSAKEAEAYGAPATQVVEGLVQTVKGAIERYRERHRPRAWLRGALVLLGAALGVALLVRLVLSRSARLEARLRERGGASTSWLFQHRRNLSAEKLLELELRLLRWGRNALIVVLTLVFLEVAFLALPITRAWATAILHYLLDPLRTLRDGFLLHVGDLFFILVIVLLVRALLRALRWTALEAKAGTVVLPMVTRDTALPAYKVVRLVVLAIAGMMIYPYIPGSSTAAFKGIGLFAGALFTLGASGAASSLIGGVTLIFTDVFRVGDRVQVGDVTGDVVEVTLFITRLRTPKNEIVTLANGGILSSRIVNYSQQARSPGLILHTSVTIGYDAPWRRVHELLLQAARATKGVQETPDPFVLQTSLDDFYVSYELNAFTRNANAMADTYSELHQNIQDAFHGAGVEIMSPHYAALRDGGAAAVPLMPGGKPAGAPRPFAVRLEPDAEARHGAGSAP
jgi:small-conductance mechanosensitive channel